jgi:CRISPR-associated protein Cas1
MSFIYIVSDNGKLHKSGETLQLAAYDGTITTIFPYKTEQLILLGNVEITGSALRVLMRNGIDTVFLGKNGRFNGKLVFQQKKNVFLRQKQFYRLSDNDFIIGFVRSLVLGKLKNQLTFMQRITRRRNAGVTLERSINKMKETIKKAEHTDDAEVLRGLEGIGARYFFYVFRHNIIQDWAVFNGRSKQPPEDNVNAVLSFLYTILFYRIDAAVEAEDIDTYVGYFHTLDYGRKSLSLDLMEEYRTPIADTLTCALFNLGTLEKTDFEEVEFSSDSDNYPLQTDSEESEKSDPVIIESKKGVLLTKGGIKKVIAQFEKKLDNQLYYPPLGKQISYRRLIIEQVKHFKRVLNGEENEYSPLIIK